MKKITVFALLAVLAILLVFSACGKSSLPVQIPAQQTSVMVQEPTPPPMPEPTPQLQPMEIYSDILNRWRTAASERWDMETLDGNGLNYMAAYCYSDDPLNRLGYLLNDIDGDGIEELLIGSITGDDYQDKIVLQLYTIENGAPKQVFNSGERDRYYLCSDRTIANEGSSSAFESCYNYYSYSAGELQLKGSVLFDMAKNKEQPWFFVMGDNKTNVDEGTANAKIAEYQAVYIAPQYTPFSQ